MLDASVKLVNTLGLHARAAAKLVRLASGFKSSIIVEEPLTNASANAKSLLSLLSLSASTGTVLILKVYGEDEKAALEGVIDLFERGFDEN
jgi:phosphocarrier protein